MTPITTRQKNVGKLFTYLEKNKFNQKMVLLLEDDCIASLAQFASPSTCASDGDAQEDQQHPAVNICSDVAKS
jgi:hypothetical protein